MMADEHGIENHCSAVAFEKHGGDVYLATARHCLLESAYSPNRKPIDKDFLFVSFPADQRGPFYPVVWMWLSKKDDVAIIKIVNAPTVITTRLGTVDGLIPGDLIEHIGFPIGMGKIVTFGRFISPRFSHRPELPIRTYGWERGMPADITVAPGSSGGPLFDPASKTLIGIVVGQLGFGGLSVVEPVSVLIELRKSLDKPS